MSNLKLSAKNRDKIGSNASRQLRAENQVPGVIYSKDQENIILSVSERDLRKVYLDAGATQIVDVIVGEETVPVIIKDIQTHPYKNKYLHVDFQMIHMDQTIRIQVPIVADGREEIKVQPSVLMQMLNEIEVESLPGDIPEEIVIDVRDMQIGDSIYIKDLDIFGDDRYTIHEEDEALILSVSEPREEEVVEDEEELDVDAADVPTIDETEDASGDDTEE